MGGGVVGNSVWVLNTVLSYVAMPGRGPTNGQT